MSGYMAIASVCQSHVVNALKKKKKKNSYTIKAKQKNGKGKKIRTLSCVYILEWLMVTFYKYELKFSNL